MKKLTVIGMAIVLLAATSAFAGKGKGKNNVNRKTTQSTTCIRSTQTTKTASKKGSQASNGQNIRKKDGTGGGNQYKGTTGKKGTGGNGSGTCNAVQPSKKSK